MKDRLVAKRFFNMLMMLLVTILITSGIAAAHDRFADEVVLYLLLDLLFFALFVFEMEHNRAQKLLSGNKETAFHKVRHGYLVSCGIILIGSFFPEFSKPVLLIPILMTACGNTIVGMYIGIFFNVMMCLATGSSALELIQYCLMTLLGCIIAEAMENQKLRFWCELVVFCISVMLPGMFYYLSYREVNTSLFLSGAGVGLAIAVFLHLFYQKLVTVTQSEVADTLDDILDKSYPLSRELLSFSKADYKHAERVSSLAGKCAELVGVDKKVCAAAGFYYRIGILDGGSIAENGIRIAQRECFPEDIIRIISEYNGEIAQPSSIESAIVHMVDGLVKKLELFDDTTMSSEWNQDMVIYQTLNDFSAQGLYDKSGLSMNMFLKIREYLVNEEVLI